jgi:hypothetical protein
MGYARGKVLERFEGHEILFTEIAQKVGEKKPKIGNIFELNFWDKPNRLKVPGRGIDYLTGSGTGDRYRWLLKEM